MANATKVVTGKVRLSYAHVWDPVSINDSKISPLETLLLSFIVSSSSSSLGSE